MTFSSGHSPAQDLAILSNCKHLVMSVGTFGWWGLLQQQKRRLNLYFSKRDDDWEKQKLVAADYYLPQWLGVTPDNITSGVNARLLFSLATLANFIQAHEFCCHSCILSFCSKVLFYLHLLYL
jgi:hypothetical protein